MWKLGHQARSLAGQPVGRAALSKSRAWLLLGLVVTMGNLQGKGRLMGVMMSWDQTKLSSEWVRCLNTTEMGILI